MKTCLASGLLVSSMLIFGGVAAAQTQASKPVAANFASLLNEFNVENTALVLIDHQVGTIDWAGELNSDQRKQLKSFAKLIAKFAKGAKMPIVLTSSLETEAQGPLLAEFKTIMPEEYAARIKRVGIINAWDDPAFAEAVRKTGRKNILMAGLTTDVCLVPPALSAKAEGFNVIALTDASAATTIEAAENSKALLRDSGVLTMTTIPMITNLLKNYKSPASGAFFKAWGEEKIQPMLGKGHVR